MISFLLLVVLVIIFFWAPSVDLVTRRLMRVFGLFSAVSLVGRSIYLLHYKPLPVYGVPLANGLLAVPSYGQGLRPIWSLADLGLAAFLVTALSVGKLGRVRRVYPTGARPCTAAAKATMVGLVGAGVLGGVLFYGTKIASLAPVGKFSVLSIVGLGTAVLRYDWRRQHLRAFVRSCCAVEIGLSLLSASKTPLLGAALILYVDPNRKVASAKAVLGAASAVVVAFAIVESMKAGIRPAPGAAVPPESWVQRISIPVLNRFDQLDELAHAYQFGHHPYIPLSHIPRRVLFSAVPQELTGQQKVLSGVLWGERVVGVTSGVSLAPNLTPEGYVEGGISGIVIWNAVGALELIVVGRLITTRSRRHELLAMVVSMAMAGTGQLFEGGLIGGVEVAGLSVQLAVSAALIARGARALSWSGRWSASSPLDQSLEPGLAGAALTDAR